MHSTFVFPMDCTDYIAKWDNIKIVDNKGEKSFWGIPSGAESYYDPFEYDTLIPEFVQLVDKVLNGANLESQIKHWLTLWGPLRGNYEEDTVKNFWKEAIKFHKLWSFYRDIANKDKKSLLSKVEIQKKTETDYVIKFFPNDESFPAEQWLTEAKKIKMIHGTSFGIETEYDFKTIIPVKIDKNREEFEQIQEKCMFFLMEQIEKYTARANLSWGTMNHQQKGGKSEFKIRPKLKTESLIDAIYLQFYILFTENEKKICPICNKPFVPHRKDQVYCRPEYLPSDKKSPCYLTAKSRRYRTPK